MKKQVEWKARNGQTLSATVELITSKKSFADGYNVDIDCCEIEITYRLDGKFIITGRPYPATAAVQKEQGISWSVDGVLGMTDEIYTLVKSAIDEIEQAPEWQAKLAKSAQNEKDFIEYEEHTKRVDEMMGM